MEPGSVDEVVERLKSWCQHTERGLARAEWDSVFARREVVGRLKRLLAESGISVVEIEAPQNQRADETVAGILKKLRAASGSVVSITGIEWAFPEGGNRLDTLVALSFKREILASIPVRQIWWMPSTMTERFVLGVPDLDSWFQLRLHLTEVPLRVADFPQIALVGRETMSVDEARTAACRFWDRLEPSRAQNISEELIWQELGQPAVEALISAGLPLEAQAVLRRMPGIPRLLEERLRVSEDPGSLSTATRLGRSLRSLGDLAASRRLLEASVEAAALLRGEKQTETATAMCELGATLRDIGDFAGAGVLGRRALEIFRLVSGEDSADTLNAMNNLALTLLAGGDLAAARGLQEQVVEATRRVCGEADSNTLIARMNLAGT
jgi:hypothetical protein